VIFVCNNRSERDEHVSYSRITVVRYFYGEQEYRMSLKRRTAWIAAISREDMHRRQRHEKYVICSRYFHSGKPAGPMDETNVD